MQPQPHRWYRNWYLTGHVALGMVALLAGCHAPAKQAKLTPEEQALNVASFDKAWEIIRDSHWDPKLGGVDWDGVKAELRPRVEAATTMGEARGAMEQMIARLGKTHFGIIPRDVLANIEDKPAGEDAKPADAAIAGSGEKSPPAAKKKGDPGIVVRVVDGKALITQVVPGSPAAQAGVAPGWLIRRVENHEVESAIARMNETFADRTYKDLLLARAVGGWMQGDVGSSVAIEFVDGRDDARKLTLARVEPRGKEVRFGHLPLVHVWWETRTLEGGIGYFALNNFFDPPDVDEAFAAALAAHRNAPGFIVDLRGNPGGIGLMAMGMAGRFYPSGDPYLGTMTTRQTSLKFVLNPRRDAYTGPLAILVDGLSASTSEVFAGGLKDLHRARIFGTTTAGAALPSQVEKLPNGDALQHAIANYVSVSGAELEGKGVTPDEVVAPNRKALLAGHDAVLDAAVAWIKSRNGTMQPVATAH